MSRPVTENDLTVRGYERDCYRSLADETARRVVSGKVALYRANEHWFNANLWPACRGESCQQGRKPCTDRCGAEMAEPIEPDVPMTLWQRARQWIHDAFGV